MIEGLKTKGPGIVVARGEAEGVAFEYVVSRGNVCTPWSAEL